MSNGGEHQIVLFRWKLHRIAENNYNTVTFVANPFHSQSCRSILRRCCQSSSISVNVGFPCVIAHTCVQAQSNHCLIFLCYFFYCFRPILSAHLLVIVLRESDRFHSLSLISTSASFDITPILFSQTCINYSSRKATIFTISLHRTTDNGC